MVELIASGIDVTDWRDAERRKDILLGELQHRVKNSLATVQAIMRFTARTAETKEALIESLQNRLGAISRTHDVLTQSDWNGGSLHRMLRDEIQPYADDVDTRLVIEGPDVTLPPDMALSLGLAIHELATNAAKYVALAQVTGTVTVEITQGDAGNLTRLRWSETGGPPVTAPQRTGFGS